MNKDQNKAIVRNFLNKLDMDMNAVDQFFVPDCLAHLPGSSNPTNREGFRDFVGLLYTAFPDLHHTVDDQLAEDDKVASLVTARGTHKGVFQGIPPKGNEVAITDIFIVRVREGKFVELWAQFDVVGLLQQLDVGTSGV